MPCEKRPPKVTCTASPEDIAAAITAQGVEIDRHEVRLPNGVFRQVGEYEVELHLHSDVNATIKLSITPE